VIAAEASARSAAKVGRSKKHRRAMESCHERPTKLQMFAAFQVIEAPFAAVLK
jgi:hypothetical protein